MNETASILSRDDVAVLDKPSWLPDELMRLPYRVLFENEFIGVVLVRLRQGHELLFKRGSRLLVTVAFGWTQVVAERGFRTLFQCSQHRVEPVENCELRVVAETDLLLFIPTVKAMSF